MRDYRRFVVPPGLVQANHSAGEKYGAGTVVRRMELPKMNVSRKVDGDSDNWNYFRRNLRLIGDPAKRAIREASEERRMLLYRRNPHDSMGQLVDFNEELAFARFPHRFRVLGETGDHSRVNILARGEMRAIRHRKNDPDGQSFLEEFDMAITAYRNWRLVRKAEISGFVRNQSTLGRLIPR